MKQNPLLPPRMILGSELSMKLRVLEGLGVKIPELKTSGYIPEYVISENNTELYYHEGKLIEVLEGQVIDINGNIINLELLTQEGAQNAFNYKVSDVVKDADIAENLGNMVKDTPLSPQKFIDEINKKRYKEK